MDNLCNKLIKFYDPNEYNYILDGINNIMLNVDNLLKLLKIKYNGKNLQDKLITNGFNHFAEEENRIYKIVENRIYDKIEENELYNEQIHKIYLEQITTTEKIKFYHTIIDDNSFCLISLEKLNNELKQKILETVKESLLKYSASLDGILTSLLNVQEVDYNDSRVECFHKSAFDIIDKWMLSKSTDPDPDPKDSKYSKEISYQYISDWSSSSDIYEYFDICIDTNKMQKIENPNNNNSKKQQQRKLDLYDKYYNFKQGDYKYKSIVYWPRPSPNSRSISNRDCCLILWPIVISYKNQLKYIQCKLIAICEINSELNIMDSLQNKYYNIFLQPIDNNDEIFNSNILISCDIHLPMSKFLTILDSSMNKSNFLNKIDLEFKNYFHGPTYRNFSYIDEFGGNLIHVHIV